MKEAGEEGNDVANISVVEPKFLYKYGKFDDYTEKIFTHNEIYFSSPKAFNDPFDSKPHLACDGTMTEIKSYLCKQYQKKYPERSKEEILTYIEMELIPKGRYKIILERAIEVARELLIEELGACCLTEKKANILMWAHYADKHTGFCLEFDVKNAFFELFTRAIKVKYKEFRPELNIVRLDSDPEGELEKRLFIKALDWDYEDEWRIVDFEKAGETQNFPEDALSGVILGRRIDVADREKVLRWCRKRKHPPSLFEAREKQKEYGLDIVRIEDY